MRCAVLLVAVYVLGPADTSDAHACSCLGPTFPPNGAVDVPLDVEVAYLGGDDEIVRVLDAGGQEIAVDRRFEPGHFNNGSWQLVKPLQPLEPNSAYRVDIQYRQGSLWEFTFTTGESMASSAASPDVESVRATYVDLAGCVTDSCGPVQNGQGVTASFQPSEQAAFYLLEYTLDGQSETRRVPASFDGHQQNSPCEVEPPVISPGAELCLAIRAVSAGGEPSPPGSSACTTVEDCQAECSIEGLAECEIEIELDAHPVQADAGAGATQQPDAGCSATGAGSHGAMTALVLFIIGVLSGRSASADRSGRRS